MSYTKISTLKLVMIACFASLVFSLSAHAEECNFILSDRVKASVHDLASLRLELDLEAAAGNLNFIYSTLESSFLKKRSEILAHAPHLSEASLDQQLQKQIKVLQAERSSQDIATQAVKVAVAKRDQEFKSTSEEIGNLLQGRYNHGVVQLSNKKILISGGKKSLGSNSETLSSSEVFDLQTNLSQVVTPLNRGRTGAKLFLLKSGKVLAVGGQDQFKSWHLKGVELIDLKKGTVTPFETEAAFTQSVFAYAADQLVLFGAGQGFTLYDVKLNSVEKINQFKGSDRQNSILLNDGRVVVVGGSFGATENSIQIIDPLNRSSFQMASRLEARIDSTLAQVDDSVFVIGGRDENSDADMNSIVQIDLTVQGHAKVGMLATGRHQHQSVTLSDGRILTFGGRDKEGNELTSIEIFDPQSCESYIVGDLIQYRYLPEVIVLPNNEVLLIGGLDINGVSISAIERIKVGIQK